MSTPSAPNVGLENAQIMQAYNHYLPSILRTQANAIPQYAQQSLSAAQQTQPAYNALNYQQASQYAMPYQDIANQLQRSQALSGAQTNLQQIQGAGGQTANAAAALNNRLNPVQAADNIQAQNLVNSINLNGLSGGEQAAVERSLNQSNYATGNLGLDNATNAVANAMNFGNYLQQKRAALGQALGVGSGVASAQNAQFNPVSIALGQPNVVGNQATSFGTSSGTGTNAGFASNAGQAGSSLSSGMYGLAGQNLSNQFQANVMSTPQNMANQIVQPFATVSGSLPSYSA